jgi:predicted ATPase
VDYWHIAGQRASARSADLEAIAHLTRGLEVARKLADPVQSAQQELKLQVALGEPLSATKGYGAPDAGAAYKRAVELCRQVGETRHLFSAMHGLWHFYYGQSEFRTARNLGIELLGLARRQADPMQLMAAHQALGQALYNLGAFAAALTHLEHAQAGPDLSPNDRYPIAPRLLCTGTLAQLLWCLGYPARALERSREAVDSARTLSHPYSLTYSMYCAIRLHLLRGEAREAYGLTEIALADSTKHGFALWTALIAFLQGWSLCQQGHVVHGVARMRMGFENALATGHNTARPMYCALLAEAYGRIGQLKDASQMVKDALNAVEASGQRYYEAETHRFNGELLLRRDRPDIEQAHTYFQRALEIARHQQAKSWELRAATSLARLWRDQGRRAEAHDLLAPVYGWFTEGFDTQDLKDAKVLLDELA